MNLQILKEITYVDHPSDGISARILRNQLVSCPAHHLPLRDRTIDRADVMERLFTWLVDHIPHLLIVVVLVSVVAGCNGYQIF